MIDQIKEVTTKLNAQTITKEEADKILLDLFGEKEVVLPENINKRYDNGELVTKERIEDEDWYYNLYQPFLTFAMGFYPPDVDKLYENIIKEFKDFFNEELSEKNKERILRWCVLIIERQGGQKDFI